MGNVATRLLITDVLATRAGYPAWILWGNCLWASVAVRRNPAWPGTGWPKITPMFSILYSYIALAYPGNVTANWLVLNRVPSALSSPIIFPIHVLCWLLVHFSPLDALYKLLSADIPYRILDAVRGPLVPLPPRLARATPALITLSPHPSNVAGADCLLPLLQIAALDNMTTALGYMEYAAEVSMAAGRDCLLHSMLGGMAMNVGGTFIRHFVGRGYEKGVETSKPTFANCRCL